MYDLNPTENLFVGRCLFRVSYFLFCCQNSFHLLSSFWLASSRIADTKQQMAGKRVLQCPLGPVKSHLPPRRCSFWQTFKDSPVCFPFKNYTVLGSHHSVFYYYQSEVLAVVALCRRSKYTYWHRCLLN